ncbi:Uncharacterized protein PECH_006067 [Penicillium ucsense]|uniref:Uncharacterized protein n=1 Tax=Penicillium ucsense TaxID=2839758 RepID=A0A8J8WFJ1_9EURO|nr:Uncharacterized protein PECM_002526 [Penicillium ucsense]KAF7735921.1 Uncharacterized protein PECH_006067 [Penicillium ucsense]
MPDEPRRIIIEKSSTVRRRYQRSNKRFKFSASQLRRIEREEELERRAQAIRDKEAKRRANKKKKAEKEAKDREERKRLGLPDPCAPKIPASQPLLSAFLGAKPASTEQRSVTDSRSAGSEEEGLSEMADGFSGGDTEVDSDCFDDLDEVLLEQGLVLPGEDEHQDQCPRGGSLKADTLRDVSPKTVSLEAGGESLLPVAHEDHDGDDHAKKRIDDDDDDDSDKFSDCSVFDHVDIIQEADAIVAARLSQLKAINSLPVPSTSPSQTAAKAMMGPPALIEQAQAQALTTFIPSIPTSDSFCDDTADYLEDVFARGCGDSFSELVQLGSGAL